MEALPYYYDLGYRFTQKYWGKGYATEASAALMDYEAEYGLCFQ